LSSDSEDARKAACLGFSEVLRSADRAHIGAFLNDVIPLIRDMLCDDIFQVRVAAGHAFRQLYKNVGNKAIEKIAPYLIDTMKTDDVGETAVDGLILVLEGCARNTFFYLVATILATLAPYQNKPNYLLRQKIVALLMPMINDTADVMVARASNALQRFAEESPELSKEFSKVYPAHMLKRINPFLREPVKQALQQSLYHTFGFHRSIAEGRANFATFINNPPAGFVVVSQKGLIPDEQAEELTEVLAKLTPITQVTAIAAMKLPDEAAAEEAQAAEGGATQEATEGGAGEEEKKVVVGVTEKQCSKCKQVKPKSKFSGKMAKKPKGVCKVCA